ncbi:N-acetylmuramoyl-L-alanine amidase [Amylibacter ulvae]|uniref:N-acetylmuramoyl-L-alanine amidase n=1 Tax=Paramylibacter ulvae TaxID=1651968 RepID=A0ABQ3D0M8_9RHOB|nr:N-acetylmuramoyl-L-alanine amidase [Amylibacter ulvae]GHA52674.1 N-acetylmuramoyl-L-alanine amidase [Amylibacter ulvae]
MVDIHHVKSQNCGPRKHGLHPDMVVLHYTAMETADAAIERLCDPSVEVSAHYVIAEDGVITQLVDESMRAWHAGAGRWGNVVDVNSHSIGIEIANKGPESDAPDFPDTQMIALQGLLAGIRDRNNIPAARVIGHSDMAPGRKFDPGPNFDWQRLAHKRLSIWPSPDFLAVPDWDRFSMAATAFGYRAPNDDLTAWKTVLDAFRLRFNPSAVGKLTGADVAIIETLARDYPCADVDLGQTCA